MVLTDGNFSVEVPFDCNFYDIMLVSDFHIHEINDNKNGFFYNFFSFVKDQDSNKAMSIIYGANCLEENQKCSRDMEKERKKAEKIIHSIRFNP